MIVNVGLFFVLLSALSKLAISSPVDSAEWNQMLPLVNQNGLPCIRVLDFHGSMNSHLLVLDTNSNSYFPEASRLETELIIMTLNESMIEVPLIGQDQLPVSFTLDGVAYGDRPTVAANKMTSFSNSFGSFMLVPSVDVVPSFFTLIFDPIASQYCMTGNPIYVTTSEYTRDIRTRLQVVSNEGNILANVTDFFEIASGSNTDCLPQEVFESIIQSITSMGSMVANETYSISNCTDVASFPLVTFSFADHDGDFNARIELHMFPEDYVERVSGDTCELKVRPSQETRILGLNLLRNIAVHFDDVNHRVGFCDPLPI
jgi:hypothetical protein